jgi:NAD(P)-dependent dehydrogenase (short-subunit alcohol dehydrogenase family)
MGTRQGLFLSLVLVVLVAYALSQVLQHTTTKQALMAQAAAAAGRRLQGKQALVVGGTAGIGRGFCEWLASNGASVVVSGRSRERGEEVVAEMRRLGAADARFEFQPVNAVLFSDIKRFTEEFVKAHQDLDLLVITAGIASMAGRTPTAEGVDEKLVMHYYGRVAMIQGLMPLLERTAAKPNSDVRVLSILSAGVHSAYKGYKTDPELVNDFSLSNAANLAGFYNDLAADQLSRLHPTITFEHAAPGFVSSSWGTELNPILRGMVRVFQVFAKSSLQCAADLGPALVDPQFKGGCRLFSQYSKPASRVPEHTDEAREFVWAHTMDLLSRPKPTVTPVAK